MAAPVRKMSFSLDGWRSEWSVWCRADRGELEAGLARRDLPGELRRRRDELTRLDRHRRRDAHPAQPAENSVDVRAS